MTFESLMSQGMNFFKEQKCLLYTYFKLFPYIFVNVWAILKHTSKNNNENEKWTKYHMCPLLRIRSQRCLMWSIEICNAHLIEFVQKSLNIHHL